MKTRPIEDASGLILGLALMKPGAFLTILHPGTNRFIQFLIDRGDGLVSTLVFDMPRSGGNTAVFDEATAFLESEGDFQFRLAVEDAPATPRLTTLQAEITSSPDAAAAWALELAKCALVGLGVEGAKYTMTLSGDVDNEARIRYNRPALEAVATKRIPIFSWLTRRLLRSLPEGDRS